MIAAAWMVGVALVTTACLPPTITDGPGATPSPNPSPTMETPTSVDVGLGMPSYADIAVDDAHRHVFLTPGYPTCNCPADSEIVVVDFSGHIVSRIGGLQDVRGLALSPSRGRLYAALNGELAVAEIDTTTLTLVTKHPTDTAPEHLTLAGNRLWALLPEAGSTSLTQLASFNLDDPEEGWFRQAGGFGRNILLAGTEEFPYLAVGPFGTSGEPLTAYKIDGGAATEISSAPNSDASNIRDLAVSRDGRLLAAASAVPVGARTWTLPVTTDEIASHSLDTDANAVTFTSDSGWLIAGGGSAQAPAAVKAFTTRGSGMTRTLGSFRVADGGLAVSGDGRVLFVVEVDASAGTPTLHIRPGPV